jgi:hypothetical protein
MQEPTTAERIAELHKEQYNDFKGTKMQTLKIVHAALRHYAGDIKYLAFLEEQKIVNPRPIYPDTQ